MLGTHGYGTIGRALVGSVSSQVVRAATCPMLLIPASLFLGDRPLLVLSAGENMEGMPEGFLDLNYEMHAALAALSGRGKHLRVEDADHYSILMDSAHAAATSTLLLELIDEARQAPIR